MNSLSPQALFAAARRAFAEGRMQEARSHLLALDRAAPRQAAVHHLRALVELRLGRAEEAVRQFGAAVRLAPHDAELSKEFGQLLGSLGHEEAALSAYERAAALAPEMGEAALNCAISLYRLGRHHEARARLHELISRERENVTAWTLLGYVERDIGNVAAAGAAFDQALELRPQDPTALNGRARIALERAESDVRRRYSMALAKSPDSPSLVLEQTEARLAEGDIGAIDDFAGFAQRLPEWTEGQIALARMLWETRRDPGYADHVRSLLSRQPGRLDLARQLIDLLAGCGHYQAAADAAADGRRAAAGSEEFQLLEAVHAGRAGDVARAEALFASMPQSIPGAAIHHSVHRIRRGDLDLARTWIEAALADDAADIGSWAVAELLYRKLGDPRSEWLSGQDGLVRTFELPLERERLEAIKALLLSIHGSGVEMVDQSVRAGTQTRWRLFDRPEPELAELRQALELGVAAYVAGLPPAMGGHPLLRHRDDPLRITGSWSVRLRPGGYHVSHIHPLGLISSACYFEVPDADAAPNEGCLELGRPPPDLMLELEPLHTIAPVAGRLVLFPSYLHHGTTAFRLGERLSVAFDVNRDPAALRKAG